MTTPIRTMPECKDCKFFATTAGECRRRAPSSHGPKWLRYHNSELLRDMAWSLRRLAPCEPPDRRDDLNEEATESGWDRWPSVDSNDWCGEFERC